MPFDNRAYNNKYQKTYVVQKMLKFNRRNEKDAKMLDWISRKPNVNNYCKELIWNDMQDKQEK